MFPSWLQPRFLSRSYWPEYFPVSVAVATELEPCLDAMDISQLEPSLDPGHRATMLCEVILYDTDQRKHCLRTALRGTLVKFQGPIPHQATVLLLVNVLVQQTDNGLMLIHDEASHAYPRPHINLQDLSRVVEVCSGAGFMGFGFEHCGFEVTLKCDHSKPLLDLAQHLHPAETVQGDVCTDSLLHPICRKATAGTLTAGVACQPYSKLGDKGHQHDMRSLTLPGVLRICFLCRFGALILECVMEAHQCPWFQAVLKSFAAFTGYHLTQGLLHLHSIWPSRRSRWWGNPHPSSRRYHSVATNASTISHAFGD